jgi:hypothetical protein
MMIYIYCLGKIGKGNDHLLNAAVKSSSSSIFP